MPHYKYAVHRDYHAFVLGVFSGSYAEHFYLIATLSSSEWPARAHLKYTFSS